MRSPRKRAAASTNRNDPKLRELQRACAAADKSKSLAGGSGRGLRAEKRPATIVSLKRPIGVDNETLPSRYEPKPKRRRSVQQISKENIKLVASSACSSALLVAAVEPFVSPRKSQAGSRRVVTPKVSSDETPSKLANVPLCGVRATLYASPGCKSGARLLFDSPDKSLLAARGRLVSGVVSPVKRPGVARLHDMAELPQIDEPVAEEEEQLEPFPVEVDPSKTTTSKVQRARKSGQKKAAGGNFVRINLRKKQYTRAGTKLTGQQYKRMQFKKHARFMARAQRRK